MVVFIFSSGQSSPAHGREGRRFAKGLDGAQVAALFEKDGVSKCILDSFELFQIESEQNMIAAVDEFIARQKAGSAPAARWHAG